MRVLGVLGFRGALGFRVPRAKALPKDESCAQHRAGGVDIVFLLSGFVLGVKRSQAFEVARPKSNLGMEKGALFGVKRLRREL